MLCTAFERDFWSSQEFCTVHCLEHIKSTMNVETSFGTRELPKDPYWHLQSRMRNTIFSNKSVHVKVFLTSKNSIKSKNLNLLRSQICGTYIRVSRESSMRMKMRIKASRYAHAYIYTLVLYVAYVGRVMIRVSNLDGARSPRPPTRWEREMRRVKRGPAWSDLAHSSLNYRTYVTFVHVNHLTMWCDSLISLFLPLIALSLYLFPFSLLALLSLPPFSFCPFSLPPSDRFISSRLNPFSRGGYIQARA